MKLHVLNAAMLLKAHTSSFLSNMKRSDCPCVAEMVGKGPLGAHHTVISSSSSLSSIEGVGAVVGASEGGRAAVGLAAEGLLVGLGVGFLVGSAT